MADKLPGNGLWGWLGRQFGYVSKAVKTEPTVTLPAKRSAPQSPAAPADSAGPAPAPDVVYRTGHVQEAEHPSQPGVKLRRTIIDEVIVEPDHDDSPGEP